MSFFNSNNINFTFVGSKSTSSGEARSRTDTYDLNVGDETKNNGEYVTGNLPGVQPSAENVTIKSEDDEDVKTTTDETQKVTGNSEKSTDLESDYDDSDSSIKPKYQLGINGLNKTRKISDSDTDSLDSTRIQEPESADEDSDSEDKTGDDSEPQKRKESDDEKVQKVDDSHKDTDRVQEERDDVKVDVNDNVDESKDTSESDDSETDTKEGGAFDGNKKGKTSATSSNSDYHDRENIELNTFPKTKEALITDTGGDSDNIAREIDEELTSKVPIVVVAPMAGVSDKEMDGKNPTRGLDENENPQQRRPTEGSTGAQENNNLVPKRNDADKKDTLQIQDKGEDVEKGKISIFNFFLKFFSCK